MKALVISGGASKISFGLGVASELNKNNSYDLYIGISAGSIISLFTAANKTDKLYNILLKAKIKDVFNISPINKNGKMSLMGIVRFLLGKCSFGKNDIFIETLKRSFSENDYAQLNKEVMVGVTNCTLSRVEYPSSKNYLYNDFIQWIYASSNIPLATCPIKIGNSWYCDGGVLHYVGIEQAINCGATEIDVILHSPLKYIPDEIDLNWQPENVIKVAERILQIMHRTTSIEDILIAGILAEKKDVKINFYFPQRPLTGQIYNLDENLAKAWYSYGVEMAKYPTKILTT